ncbi:MAG: DUF4115 domain-containing protein [Casimicrobiaceae bacterium]|nr:DUF4115 domain-containing protein [Casimicrobiaceae bacterium]MCX8097885.1 DUF4115 domain-containing protein [Casimicrobiaceae bacterium]MDW8313227.1 DUF4115 domain-containing protein [Burkholderiales bacterium]
MSEQTLPPEAARQTEALQTSVPDGVVASEPASTKLKPGERLRAAREAAGWSVADVAAKLKLVPRQIEAMESGDWSALPPRPYARGFYRNYARLLGIDPESLELDPPPASASMAVAPDEPASGSAVSAPTVTETPQRRNWTIPVGLVLILLAGAVYLKQTQPSENKAPISPAGTTQRTGPASVTSAPASTPSEAAAPSAPEPKHPSAPAAPSASSPSPAEARSPTLSDARRAKVRLQFAAPSWTEVRSNDEVIFREMAEPGVREFVAPVPLRFVIGNASAVSLEIDGQPIDLAPVTQRDVARLQWP